MIEIQSGFAVTDYSSKYSQVQGAIVFYAAFKTAIDDCMKQLTGLQSCWELRCTKASSVLLTEAFILEADE
jgi:hypothetical protein